MIEHPKSGRGRRGRGSRSRPKRKRFLIVCEGEVTEVRDFKAFPVAGDVEVTVKGEGKNTTSLVAAAIEYADGDTYTDVWVVYDHDDFGAEKFNAAEAAVSRENDTRSETWRAAWSNQAFEVWYLLLHFQYFDGKLHRHLVQEKVGELLRKNTKKSGYKKNDPEMYSLLKGSQEEAIKRAKRLEEEHRIRPHGQTPPADANPCTTVHHLVVALNQEIR